MWAQYLKISNVLHMYKSNSKLIDSMIHLIKYCCERKLTIFAHTRMHLFRVRKKQASNYRCAVTGGRTSQHINLSGPRLRAGVVFSHAVLQTWHFNTSRAPFRAVPGHKHTNTDGPSRWTLNTTHTYKHMHDNKHIHRKQFQIASSVI